MLFLVDTTAKSATPIEAENLANLKLSERFDLQEWVLACPSLLGEDLLVVTSEFDQFDRTSERLDALMIDRQGKLVVVELKRSAVGTAAELQALRYAAYCSTLALDDIVEMYAAFHNKRLQREISRDEAHSEILSFVADPAFEELGDKPRVIIAAEQFPPQMTATMLWLRTYEVDISAVRLRAHRVAEQVVLESSVIIPLPEAEEYLVRRERKEVEQATKARGRNEKYRLFFQALIDRLREDHDFTNARAGQPQNWYSFASGVASGITYGAAFTKQGLRTEVYIDVGNREVNKRIFDALHEDAEAIQEQFDVSLSWERLDDRRASRVGIYNGTVIDAPDAELDAAREWATRTLLRVKEIFGPKLMQIV